MYVGDNQNVRTWISNRAPKNRIARYLTRILNRLEVDNKFTMYPLYVSSLNNRLCDELSRLRGDEAHTYATSRGFKRVDIHHVFRWYLDDRMRSLSLI